MIHKLYYHLAGNCVPILAIYFNHFQECQRGTHSIHEKHHRNINSIGKAIQKLRNDNSPVRAIEITFQRDRSSSQIITHFISTLRIIFFAQGFCTRTNQKKKSSNMKPTTTQNIGLIKNFRDSRIMTRTITVRWWLWLNKKNPESESDENRNNDKTKSRLFSVN